MRRPNLTEAYDRIYTQIDELTAEADRLGYWTEDMKAKVECLFEDLELLENAF